MLVEHSKAEFIGFDCPEDFSQIDFSTLIRGDLKLSDYDFNSAAVSLIPSVNGRFSSEERDKYGIYRFANLISNCEALNIKPTSDIIYQATSYGNLSKSYLDKFIDTLSGNLDEMGEPLSEDAKRATLKLIYPTQEYVDKIMEERSKLILCNC